jgi:hypothetical protein
LRAASAEAAQALPPLVDAAGGEAQALPARQDVAVEGRRVGQLPADWAGLQAGDLARAEPVAPLVADWVRGDSAARQAGAPALPADDSSQDGPVEPPAAGSLPADSPEL